ncbi:Dot/Icm T4SS effector VpdC [Legionella erythra]|uniref:Esterase of the alpha-beta hydrolase superfamily protein n=1 Tax=Legionella erythra TaxID=448 RepID=A0A0W0TLU9_LEGER|nr:Dot/Icm T4SS effector VpdC [Legionella erythra]KTC96591.1 esterase of the alpha-beta hydrolase superfamily protein [Legionella erythra]
MARENVLSDLLHRNTAEHPNTRLLQKILLCIHRGWFRINGLAPDSHYTLGNYLLDDERIIFDYTRLSDEAKEKFIHWFLTPHCHNAQMAFLSGVATNDYRGYTAEVGLSWWGRITNLLYYRRKAYHWPLTPLELTLNYQLTGVEICPDKYGLLIGLKQFATESNGSKYRDPDDNQLTPLRNAKRLILTDRLVESLIHEDLDALNYDDMIFKPHLYAIRVPLQNQRMEEMYEYRQTQRFITTQTWYQRLWRWIKSWYEKPNNEYELEEFKFREKNYQPLIEEDDVMVSERPSTGEILITEKRPELDNMVFCGGGGKIFAHVGAYKACEAAGINPTRFAGSSAGAIMAVLCYLGYTSEEILNFFKEFRQENLIHFDIDSSGMSDTQAVKGALDFMVTQKVNQIIRRYEIDTTAKGRKFLSDEVLYNNKITFASLKALKARYPDCGLGNELIVTATNIKRRKTRYFSSTTTPDLEVSAVVTMSASLPVVFKPTIFEGEPHNDGGVLNNLPTNVFHDNHSTLLTSEYGNCLSLLAFQFDNGCERGLLDKLVDRIYRENFIWNWIYGFLTGVKDPVSGWEQDRLRLMQHSNQVVLLPTGNVSATQFNITPEEQAMLVQYGEEAVKNYIAPRYDTSQSGKARNEEYMYANFASIEEALYFTCFRNRKDWFERLADIALERGMTADKINEIRERHFPQPKSESARSPYPNEGDFFNSGLSTWLRRVNTLCNMQIFESMFPIFLKLPAAVFKKPADLKIYKVARHSFALSNPHHSLDMLLKINGEVHVLFAILKQITSRLNVESLKEQCQQLKWFESILNNKGITEEPVFYANWELTPEQATRLFKAFQTGNLNAARLICHSLKNKEEPLQTVVKGQGDELIYTDDYHEDTDYWRIKGNRAGYSV